MQELRGSFSVFIVYKYIFCIHFSIETEDVCPYICIYCDVRTSFYDGFSGDSESSMEK